MRDIERKLLKEVAEWIVLSQESAHAFQLPLKNALLSENATELAKTLKLFLEQNKGVL